MRKTIESFLALGGIASQAVTYVSYSLGILNDIFYVFVISVIALFLSLWYCISVWTDTIESPGSVIGVQETVRPRVYRRSRFARFASPLLVLISILIAVLIWLTERHRLFLIAEIDTPVILESGRLLPTSNYKGDPDDQIPTSVIRQGSFNSSNASQILATGAGVRFTLFKRARVPWIEVKELRVIVEDVQPIPSDMKAVYETRTLAQAYLAEIDDPKKTLNNVFIARYLSEKKIGDEAGDFAPAFSTYLIDNDHPIPFVVLLKARTPGLYTYTVEIVVRHRWYEQVISVCSHQKCVFEKEHHTDMPPVPDSPPPPPENPSAQR